MISLGLESERVNLGESCSEYLSELCKCAESLSLLSRINF